MLSQSMPICSPNSVGSKLQETLLNSVGLQGMHNGSPITAMDYDANTGTLFTGWPNSGKAHALIQKRPHVWILAKRWTVGHKSHN